jgi:cold shock CspA family protein
MKEQTPVQVTFRGMDVSDAVEAACWKECEKLERYDPRIVSCRVSIARPDRRQKGNLYDVRIDVRVPGRELVVSRKPPQHQTDEDVLVALREAFDTMRRQLEDQVRRQRGQVKFHETPAHGRVCTLHDDGYGFIRTADGREVYFHRNSVLGDAYDRLEVGSEVRFAEEQGSEGPQASTVTLVGRHHHLAP